MVAEFLTKYFIDPIYLDSGYNLVNTIVYAIIALVLLYGIYKGLEKLKIKIDRKFFYAILPFVVFGASLRAFVDNEIISLNFWTVSPGIWISITGLFLLCFLIGWYLEKEAQAERSSTGPSKTKGFAWEYWKICIGTGTFLIIGIWIFGLNKLQFINTWGGLTIIGLALGISALFYYTFNIFKIKQYLDGCSFLPFMAHMLDASATFIAVDFFGAIEKHPLTRTIGEWTGTAASLFVLKLAILLPMIYLIQTQIKNKNLANYLLISIAVLGLSEGLRDLITLVLV